MKPTGKNKEQFEKRYYTFEEELTISEFYELPFEMQLGVYLAYYDSTKYKITINHNGVADWYFRITENRFYFIFLKSSRGDFKTRKEAYKEAFKKANKLINKSLEE